MAGELSPAPTADRRVVAMIGFMGAGKTTAARDAARALGTTAVDVDHELEARLGRSIADIFAQDGEAAFRAQEERLTLELLRASGTPRAGARRWRDRLAGHPGRSSRASRGLDRCGSRDGLAALAGRGPPAGQQTGTVSPPSSPSANRCMPPPPISSCRPRAFTGWP